MSEEALALIEERTQQLLTWMGFTEVKMSRAKDGQASQPAAGQQQLHLNIDAGESGRLLIGAHGSHLAALQHIVRVLARRSSPAAVEVTVDVNGYRAGRERTLLHLAEEAVRQAQRTGRAISLPPMVSLERRIIHTSLAARQHIKTESLGEEPNRRVVIK